VGVLLGKPSRNSGAILTRYTDDRAPANQILVGCDTCDEFYQEGMPEDLGRRAMGCEGLPAVRGRNFDCPGGRCANGSEIRGIACNA
jgi:hypothetical protein